MRDGTFLHIAQTGMLNPDDTTDVFYYTMKSLLFCFIAVLLAVAGISAVNVRDTTETTVEEKVRQSAGVKSENLFEKAVEIIKKYEGLHAPRHWPLVGYGHKVLPGEKFSRTRQLSATAAEDLLRKDLQKLCRIFRDYGPDSLIMATLAYNIGHGAAGRSTVAKKLKEGIRDIRENYIAHCRYRGKQLSQLRQRRIEEFESLFLLDTIEYKTTKTVSQS